MAMRAWRVWATGVVLAVGIAAAAKPPDVPGKPRVDGKVPSSLSQEHYQPESRPEPGLLPESVIGLKPFHGPETADPEIADLIRNLEFPIRVTSFGHFSGPSIESQALAHLLKVRAAFEQAESHFDDCELDEARSWYQEVIRLAPTSKYAKIAEERLRFGKVFPAGPGESREPPLADGPELPRPIPATTAGRLY